MQTFQADMAHHQSSMLRLSVLDFLDFFGIIEA